MSSPVSDEARDILARSLPIVHSHKQRIIERIAVHLRGATGQQEEFGRSEAAALLLVQQLLDQARSFVDHDKPAATAGVLEEHHVLEIDGRHYSRFGDALVPVLSDVLGASVLREVPRTWCDAFWAGIRALEPHKECVSGLAVGRPERRDARGQIAPGPISTS